MGELWTLIWGTIVDKFGLFPALLLVVVAIMYRQQQKYWQGNCDRYEREIDRIGKEKSELWSRLLGQLGESRNSSSAPMIAESEPEEEK